MFDVEMRGRQLCTAAHCTYARVCGTAAGGRARGRRPYKRSSAIRAKPGATSGAPRAGGRFITSISGGLAAHRV